MKPMLLDTSALQNVRYMSEFLDGSFLTDDDAAWLRLRHGRLLGDELVALGNLINLHSRNGPAWLISETSLIEFARATGDKGRQLLDWWWEWAHYMQGCIDAEWFSEIDVESLAAQRGPEVHEDQLPLPMLLPAPAPLTAQAVPPLGPFPDAGDRAVIRDAIRAGVSSIITTDIKTFLRHRSYVRPFGIEVFRPTEIVSGLRPVAA